MRGSARMTSGSVPCVRSTTRVPMRGRPRTPDEKTQRLVAWTCLEPLTEHAHVDRVEHRPTVGINNGDDNLRRGRDVEHDSITRAAAVHHIHELAYADRFHRPSVLWGA